ncbi:hypothetical protein ACNOYE_11435 [Nannocystaceae bacterium ST9]
MRTNQMLGIRAEPPASEITIDSHAIVLPFELDLAELDPEARAGLSFLQAALHRLFITPAMQTRSSEEFGVLWSDAHTRALGIMQSIATLLYEATSDLRSSTVAITQLTQGDRRAADALATKVEQDGKQDHAEQVRNFNVLISRARACVGERRIWNPKAPLDLILEYRQSNLTWAVAMVLFMECIQEWLPPHGPRPDLIEDCLMLAEDGARMAGISALLLCDVEFQGEDSAWWSDLFRDIVVFDFLLEAQRRVRRSFTNSTTVTIKHFIDPEGNDADATHFSIETELPPEQACARFEAFCEDWWYGAIDEIGVALSPVLDVAR